MKYMQAEDAEQNPSNCMSREIAVKVNNELQQTHTPLLLLLLFLLLPELLETCSQLSRESVNFPLPGFNSQASPYSSLICNWFDGGLTLWAERRQERGCCWGGEPGGEGADRSGVGRDALGAHGHSGSGSELTQPLLDRHERRAARLAS